MGRENSSAMGKFVKLRENREYGEFSWRASRPYRGELEPVLADLQFLDAGVQG
jgi:hypothetical protein